MSCENDSAAQGFIHSTQDQRADALGAAAADLPRRGRDEHGGVQGRAADLPMRAEMAELMREVG